MYVLIYDTYDYTNQKFITQPGAALEEFAQEKEDLIENGEDYVKGIYLVEVIGDGSFQIQIGVQPLDDNIKLIDSYEPEN